MRTIRIGTRTSKLAIEQARLVGEGLVATARAQGAALAYELVGMTTEGDRILDQPLDKIGGKGLFIRELDRAMLAGRIDIAVHSCKDLPTELDPSVRIGAVSAREDPRDALVLPVDAPAAVAETFDVIAAYVARTGLPVGCSSARRRVQLQRLMPGVSVASVRGNVNTRLAKLDAGQYGALVLAAAGLKRLGLGTRMSYVFAPYQMLPAAGQGAMAVTVAREADASLCALLEAYSNDEAALCVAAERAFTRALGGDCATPCGAYAEVHDAELCLEGLYAEPDGSVLVWRSGRVIVDAAGPDGAYGAAAYKAAEACAERLASEVREALDGGR